MAKPPEVRVQGQQLYARLGNSFPSGLLTTAWPWLGFSRPAFPISLTFPAAWWPSSKVWMAQIHPSSFCRLRSAACCRDTVFAPPSKKKTRCRAAKCLWLLTGPAWPVHVDVTLNTTDVGMKCISRRYVTVTMVMSRQNAALAIRGQATESWAVLSKPVPSLFRPR